MGERTVRELLKRRSDDTVRRIQSRRGRKQKARAPKHGRRIILWLLLAVIAGGPAWAGWLTFKAREDFRAHQWIVPARVYARALELYPGMNISRDALLGEFRRLGYAEMPRPDRPGSFAIDGERIRFVTRSFRFWDGEQPSLDVIARLRGNRLVSLQNASGQDLFLVRLEPPLIGSLFPASGEDRILVRLEEVPPVLVEMLLAVEDRRFREHHGLDFRAIARAMGVNLAAGEIRQGGSTITQQLVKNFYLTPERSFVRKANEAVMAFAIDLSFDKDEILEAYLNEVYLGQDGNRAIHGVGLASHFYFQKPLRELREHELALLVAMVRGPSVYDPRRHPERALARRNQVLEIAAEQGVLDEAKAQAAIAAELRVTPKPPQGTTFYPAFMDLLKQQLKREYAERDLTTTGLQIFSTLDPVVQIAAERALQEGIAALEKDRQFERGSLEGAIVVTSVQGAEVQAIVGGREARFAGFNRALAATRPVGSLIKPVVFLSALQKPREWTLATPVDDTPVEVELPNGKVWAPDNFRSAYHGTVPLIEALAGSYNAATVRVGMRVGVNNVLLDLQKLGFSRAVNAYPSVLLGAVSMTPLEVAQVYNTLAGGGFRSPVNAIREVLRPDGSPLQRYPLTVNESVDPRAVYLVNQALLEVTRSGTASAAGRALDVRVAGKTGTTDDFRDSWFAGFSGDRVAVVWIGRDSNEPAMLTGASGALPVWARLMREAAQEDFVPARPAGIEDAWVDMKRLAPSTSGCGNARELAFIAGSAPQGRPVCSSSLTERIRDIFQ